MYKSVTLDVSIIKVTIDYFFKIASKSNDNDEKCFESEFFNLIFKFIQNGNKYFKLGKF